MHEDYILFLSIPQIIQHRETREMLGMKDSSSFSCMDIMKIIAHNRQYAAQKKGMEPLNRTSVDDE